MELEEELQKKDEIPVSVMAVITPVRQAGGLLLHERIGRGSLEADIDFVLPVPVKTSRA